MYPGSNFSVAPVVQAQPESPQGLILDLIKQALGAFVKEGGSKAATMLFDQWTHGGDQSTMFYDQGTQGGYESW
jgi:hypothetical protein